MRFQSSLLVLGVIALSSAGVAQTPTDTPAPKVRQIVPTGTTSFTSKPDGFSVWLPAKPVQNQWVAIDKSVRSPDLIPCHQFKVEADSIVYKVILVSRPLGVNKSKPIGTLVDKPQKLVKSFKAELQSSEAIQLQSFEGLEMKLSSRVKDETVFARVYLTPQYLYQIFAIGPKEQIQKHSAQIDKVFDSFRILPQ